MQSGIAAIIEGVDIPTVVFKVLKSFFGIVRVRVLERTSGANGVVRTNNAAGEQKPYSGWVIPTDGMSEGLVNDDTSVGRSLSQPGHYTVNEYSGDVNLVLGVV